MAQYRYELWRGDVVVGTGRFDHPEPLEVGDRNEIGGQTGIVRTIEPVCGASERRLVLQLLHTGNTE